MALKKLKIPSVLVSPSASLMLEGWFKMIRSLFCTWHSGVLDARLSVVGHIDGRLDDLHGRKGNNG